MPKFDHSQNKGNDNEDKDLVTVPEGWSEPRCHVCTSDYRRAIDRMIALGTGHSEISRIFGGVIDRRSISNHARKHLAYAEAAVRQIIEQQTRAAEEDVEEGVSGITKRKVYLETALHKAMEALVGDNVIIEPKDAVNIIESLNQFDRHTESVQLETVKIQFNAFLQAIREVAALRDDPSLGSDILIRAREIVGAQVKEAPQLTE